MSWSDDDWDPDEALAKAKKDDSDELDESSEEEKPKAQPKPKPKPETKKKEAGYVPLDDPIAEKLRRQRIIEEEDAKLTDDLFSGCAKPGEKPEEKKQREDEEAAKKEAEKKAAEAAKQKVEIKYIMKDSLDDLQMKLHNHVDTMTKMVAGKLKTAAAKDAKVKFLEDTMKEISGKIEYGEMEKLQKAIKESIAARKKAVLEAKKKKEKAADEKEQANKEALLKSKEEKEKAGEKLTDEEFFAQFM